MDFSYRGEEINSNFTWWTLVQCAELFTSTNINCIGHQWSLCLLNGKRKHVFISRRCLELSRHNGPIYYNKPTQTYIRGNATRFKVNLVPVPTMNYVYGIETRSTTVFDTIYLLLFQLFQKKITLLFNSSRGETTDVNNVIRYFKTKNRFFDKFLDKKKQANILNSN